LSHAEFAPWLQFTNVPGEKVGTQTSLHQGSLTLKAASSFSRKFRLEATGTGFFGETLPNDRVDTGDSLSLTHRELGYFGGEGTLEGIWQPFEPVRVVLGLEGSADREHLGAPEYQDREDGDALPAVGTTEDFDTTLFNVAGRAQVSWEVIKKYFVPTGGIRLDHNTVYGERVSGRIALVSEVYDHLFLKSAYGTAFKAATPLLLYGSPMTVGDVIGSPSLKPQELRSFEFTVDYRPTSIADFEFTVSNWQLLDRAVFRREQINLVARNAADANGWSLEGQLKSRFSERVGFFLGAEWVKVRRESGEEGYRGELFGNDSAIYPEFIVRGRLWTQPSGWPFEFWSAGKVVGPRKASDSNTLEAADRYVLPTYVTVDAGARTVNLYWWDDRLTEFSLRAENVVNSAKPAAGFFGIDYPAAPPKVLLEIRQEL
jgi:iron complex outermembrane receptor protein